MTNEIFYLESCLAIEKSMVEVSEACHEAIGDIDDGFLFESSKNVFQTIKEKIKKLIERVRGIFTGKVAKAQEASVAKKAKTVGNAQVEVHDAAKVKKLYDKASSDIKKGKDPKKVNSWFKKGLIALGVISVAGGAAAVGVSRHKKKMNASKVQNYVSTINKQVLQDGKTLDKDTTIALKYAEKSLANAGKTPKQGNSLSPNKHPKGMADDAIAKANGLTELFSNYTKALNTCRNAAVSDLKALPIVSKDAITAGMNRNRIRKNESAHKSNKMRSAYGTGGDYGDGANGFNESFDDIFDDDLMLADDFEVAQESFDDIFSNEDVILADESADDYSDIFGEDVGC